MRIANDLNCDAMDLAELTMALEDAFGIEIPESESFDWNSKKLLLPTVQDWQALVVRKVRAA
jgi:acyl carrier protein